MENTQADFSIFFFFLNRSENILQNVDNNDFEENGRTILEEECSQELTQNQF